MSRDWDTVESRGHGFLHGWPVACRHREAIEGGLAVFYLSVHDLDGGHVFSQADRLLEALKREHGEPRYDIPPQLEKRNGRKTTASPRH
jgi:hypothetical protein